MKNFLILLSIIALGAVVFLSFERGLGYYIDNVNLQIFTQDSESFTSPEVNTVRPFNAWFIKFTQDGRGKVQSFEVRFKKAAGWDDWLPLELDIDAEQNILSGYMFINQLVRNYQFRLTISGDMGYQVTDFDVETQNTTRKIRLEMALFPRVFASLSDTGIISRDTWGANPDYLLKRETPSTSSGQTGEAWEKRMTACDQLQLDYPMEFKDDGRKISTDTDGKALQWPRTYSQAVKKIIIHHTYTDEGKDLNGDKNISREDVEALLRAIYYYHAVFRGWGDIGYHYLIDPLGNVYEGRSGGDNVIGAHAYCVNTGTIGISFIGDFTSKLPTKTALDSATKLLGELSNLYKLKLSEVNKWHGKETHNLVGHRDYAATSCPGNSLYSYLPELATRADQYAAANAISEIDYAYTFVRGDTIATLNPLEKKNLTFQIRNSGQQAWPVGTRLQVESADITRHEAGLSIVSEAAPIVISNNPVASGETVTLTLLVAAKLRVGSYQLGVTPVVGGQTLPKFNLEIRVTNPVGNYTFVSAQHPPRQLTPGETAAAFVDLKNTSNFTWKSFGENRIYLGSLKPQGATHLFTEKTEIATLAADVAPGQIAHFILSLEAPQRLGEYIFKFAPAVMGYGYLPDYDMKFPITVREPRFAAEALEKTGGSAARLDPGDTGDFFVKLKNTSQFVWEASSFSLELLGNSEVKIPQSALNITNNVAIDAQTTLTFPVTAPSIAGQYRFSLRPRWQSGDRLKTGELIQFILDVNPPLLNGKLQTEPLTLTLAEGEGQQVTVAYLNTGNVTWHQKDVILQRLPAIASSFANSDWRSPLHPAQLAETIVRPKEIGNFIFIVKKNTVVKRETETFVPIMTGLGRIRGSATTITLQLKTVTAATEKKFTVLARPQAELLSAFVLTTTPAANTSVLGPTIRIRLSFYSDKINIGGGKFQIQKDSKVLFTGSFADFHKAKLKDGDFYRVVPIGDTILEILNWQRNASAKYNYNKFRGILEIRRIGNEMILINELPLETYLHGIAEPSPRDPDAKQQVMVLLTRSYAYYYTQPFHRKFPSKPYDGSDSPAEFQQYLGYNYEILSNFPKWVDETTGKVLTYDGNVVKTPYFTSSSGKTRSPIDARWNAADFPFVRVVEDPWSCGLTSSAIGTAYSCPDKARGHGVGLSGTGAAGLAREGKTAAEIIDYFYQNLEVKNVY